MAHASRTGWRDNGVGLALTEDVLSQLLKQVAMRDRGAFREVYARSAGRLAGVLTRMLGDRTEVEDALQDVYIRVWQRAAQFEGARGSGIGWLVAIARSVALDRLRARPEARGLQPVTASGDGADDDPIARLPAGGPDAEGHLLAMGEARRAVDCMGELEPDRAAAVRGAYLLGRSYHDLAQRHGVPLNTMRSWLRRSLLRLKECLDR